MTAPSPVTCPHCGQMYGVTSQQVGQQFQCTRCNQPFIAGAPSGMPPGFSPIMPIDEPTQGNGMALASLILGIFLCIPVASLLAVIFGIIGIKKTSDPRVGGKGMAIAGLVLGILGLMLLPVILLPAINRARQVANRVESAKNLNQIGSACRLYANEFEGAFPPDLGTLATAENLPVQTFIAPNSEIAAPGNLSGADAANWINNYSDYIYLGSDLRVTSDPGSVVAYEKDQTNHGDGVNMLFADGHVAFFTLDGAHEEIAKSNATPVQ
jgi:prepilin-type processing-associated H-X9-DG protein